MFFTNKTPKLLRSVRVSLAVQWKKREKLTYNMTNNFK